MKSLSKGFVALFGSGICAAGIFSSGNQPPGMIDPQYFETTNSIYAHFRSARVHTRMLSLEAPNGSQWFMCATTPYSGAIACDIYLFRAQDGAKGFRFIALYMVKNVEGRDCKIVAVDSGVWVEANSERVAFFKD